MSAQFSLAYRLIVRAPSIRGRPFLSLGSAGSQRFDGTRRMRFSQLQMSPLTFPKSGFDSIDVSEKIEEETLPTYKAEKYYPAQIGDIFKDRYQIVGKLGYGVTSTVWLCRDLQCVLFSSSIMLSIYILTLISWPVSLGMWCSSFALPPQNRTMRSESIAT